MDFNEARKEEKMKKRELYRDRAAKLLDEFYATPRFVAYFYPTGLSSIGFGFQVRPRQPHIEVHLPFGFFRIGWVRALEYPERKPFGFEGGMKLEEFLASRLGQV